MIVDTWIKVMYAKYEMFAELSSTLEDLGRRIDALGRYL